jgi:hypothetical protein
MLGGVRRGALLHERDAVWLHHRDALTALDLGDADAAANAIAHGVEQNLVKRVELSPQGLEIRSRCIRICRVGVNEHYVLSIDGLRLAALRRRP